MGTWRIRRIFVRPFLVVAFIAHSGLASADDLQQRRLRHLELRSIGGGADYARPYSPICFSPDGKRLAVSLTNRKSAWERIGSDANSVLCQDVPEGSGIGIWEVESLRFLNWIEADAYKVIRFTPDGKSIAALDDSHLILWDAASGEESKVELLKDASWANELKSGFCWGPDDSVVVRQSKALAHYSATGERLGEFTIKSSVDIVTLESSVDRQRVVADHYRWNLASGEQVSLPLNSLWHSVLRPSDGTLWGRSDRGGNGAIAKWDPATSKISFPFKEGMGTLATAENGTPQFLIEGVAFHPNGKVLASIGYDKCVHLWNVENGTRIVTLELAKGPRIKKDDGGVGRPKLLMVRFSPDARWLIAASVESISIFDVNQFREKLKANSVYRLVQYFAGNELVEEEITNRPGAQTLVGSKMHVKELKPGTRVAALMPDNDEIWYDAVILAKVQDFSGKNELLYNVHYEGYSREDDKRVSPWRVRPKLAPHLKVRDMK